MSNQNYQKVKIVLWLILVANLVVAILKISIGTMIKSTSLTSDGFHSLADGSSNIIGLVGIRFASQPVDKEHPYGHRKFEVLAGMFIAGMLLVMGGNIILNAIDRLIHPVVPSITLESLIILVFTLVVNVFVCVFEYKQGIKLKSQILISDSMHTKSDIYVSIGVLVTLGGIILGLPIIVDALVSFVVAGFILHAAYEIFFENSGILVDKVGIDPEIIKQIAMSFEQVRNVHNIRSRGSEYELHIDMHVMMEPDLSIEDSHVLIHNIENAIRAQSTKNVQLIAHIEPYWNQ